MKTVKVIAMLDIGHGVELKRIKGKHSTEYSVSYCGGLVLFGDFEKAWHEFQSCCTHCLESESLIK
jgi:hypothetical protein